MTQIDHNGADYAAGVLADEMAALVKQRDQRSPMNPIIGRPLENVPPRAICLARVLKDRAMSESGKKPRVGGPAKGAGYGGPAAGPGWGGPAKGAGNGSARAPELEAGHTLSRGFHDMSKSQRLKALKDRLFELAMDRNAPEMAQIRAIEAYLDRDEGKSVQRNVIATTGDVTALDDAALARIAFGAVEDESETQTPRRPCSAGWTQPACSAPLGDWRRPYGSTECGGHGAERRQTALKRFPAPKRARVAAGAGNPLKTAPRNFRRARLAQDGEGSEGERPSEPPGGKSRTGSHPRTLPSPVSKPRSLATQPNTTNPTTTPMPTL